MGENPLIRNQNLDRQPQGGLSPGPLNFKETVSEARERVGLMAEYPWMKKLPKDFLIQFKNGETKEVYKAMTQFDLNERRQFSRYLEDMLPDIVKDGARLRTITIKFLDALKKSLGK